MLVTLPRSYKDNLVSLPGIRITRCSRDITVSICQTTLPNHCQFKACQATLRNALQSLQSISKLASKDSEEIAQNKRMVEAIAKSLRDYLLFDSDTYFNKHIVLNMLAWLLLLTMLAIVVFISLAVPFMNAIYLLMLVPVLAGCLGLATGFISNRVAVVNQLDIAYKGLVNTIDEVNKKFPRLSLMTIEELRESMTSLSSLDKLNYTAPLKSNRNAFFSRCESNSNVAETSFSHSL
jgi:hypothetical protein